MLRQGRVRVVGDHRTPAQRRMARVCARVASNALTLNEHFNPTPRPVRIVAAARRRKRDSKPYPDRDNEPSSTLAPRAEAKSVKTSRDKVSLNPSDRDEESQDWGGLETHDRATHPRNPSRCHGGARTQAESNRAAEPQAQGPDARKGLRVTFDLPSDGIENDPNPNPHPTHKRRVSKPCESRDEVSERGTAYAGSKLKSSRSGESPPLTSGGIGPPTGQQPHTPRACEDESKESRMLRDRERDQLANSEPSKDGLKLPYPSGPHWQRLVSDVNFRKTHKDKVLLGAGL